MKSSTKVVLPVAVIGIVIGVFVPVAVGQATTQTATTVSVPPGHASCAGDTHTVSWTAPPDVSDLTGYRVVRFVTTMNPPLTFTTDVGAEQTSLTYEAVFGVSFISVFAVTSQGVASEPFASGISNVGRPPQPMQWTFDGNTVGDGTATVNFRWPGPVKLVTTGGLPNTVRVTASPSGTSIDLPVVNDGAQATFSGLTNGVGYTFTATTTNACGSSTGGRSPTFTPGLAPSWLRSTPPLTASPGEYVYKFAADGAPAPALSLRDAPPWLSISPKGLVSGRPPAGTTSFSYWVGASNGVGIEVFQITDIVAGPFSVSVRVP